MNHLIKYRNGYKYQLAESYHVQLDHIRPVGGVNTPFISLSGDGLLIVKRGYAWDGPSGLAVDTKDSMRPSLVHDALFQLMREGYLSRQWFGEVNALFYTMLLEDGMEPENARAWYSVVINYAAPYADPANDRKIITAP